MFIHGQLAWGEHFGDLSYKGVKRRVGLQGMEQGLFFKQRQICCYSEDSKSIYDSSSHVPYQVTGT